MEGVEYQRRPCQSDREEAIGRGDGAGTSVFPTSTVQRQFWLLHQLAPGSAAYNIPYAFRIRGPVDCSALRRSLEEIVRRHDVFRTTFAAQGDQLVQIVSQDASFDLPVIDLTGFAADEASATIDDMIHAEAVRPFDLHNGPLIRAAVLRLSPEEHVFVLVMHHIITDLHSLDCFFREVTTLYAAHSIGAPNPLEKPVHRYSDYAVWEQQWLTSDEASAMVSYWEEALRGREALLRLPTDRPRPAVPSTRGGEIRLQLSNCFTARLKEFNRRAAMPWFGTLLSAFMVLLHRYSKQRSIIVGVPFTNRRKGDFHDVMGCFVNVLPIQLDVSDGPSFRQVMQRVRQAMLGAHRCQEVTLESIVRRLRLDRYLSHNPLYQVGMTYSPAIEFTLRNTAVEPLNLHTGSSQLDMFASLWESGEEIHGRIEFSTDLFDRTTMERLVRDYEGLVESAVLDADQPIATMPMSREAERSRLPSDG